MPETAQTQTTQPAPQTLLGLVEDTLLAPLRPRKVFEAAARRPAPAFLAMLANASLFILGFFALNLTHAAILFPQAVSGYPIERFAVAGAAGLLLGLAATLLTATVVELAARVAGGAGDFARSYQAVSTLSGLLLFQALCLWFAPAAALPTVLAAALAAVAVESLHRGKPGATRALFACLAALTLFAGWAVKRQVQKLLAPYAAMRRSLAELQDRGPLPAAPEALPGLGEPPLSPPPSASSLDLVASPGWDPAGAAPPVTPQQAQAAAQAGADLLGAVMPMLSNPALAKNLTPAQQRQMQELTGLIAELQAQMQSGKALTQEQRAQNMAKIQRLTSQMMILAAGAKLPAAGGAPEAGRPPR